MTIALSLFQARNPIFIAVFNIYIVRITTIIFLKSILVNLIVINTFVDPSVRLEKMVNPPKHRKRILCFGGRI